MGTVLNIGSFDRVGARKGSQEITTPYAPPVVQTAALRLFAPCLKCRGGSLLVGNWSSYFRAPWASFRMAGTAVRFAT
jgi:hypothetical protein